MDKRTPAVAELATQNGGSIETCLADEIGRFLFRRRADLAAFRRALEAQGLRSRIIGGAVVVVTADGK